MIRVKDIEQLLFDWAPAQLAAQWDNVGLLVGEADATVKKIRFSHFKTVFAYSRAAQYSEIGATGDTKYISAVGGINFYPGEKIQLFYEYN